VEGDIATFRCQSSELGEWHVRAFIDLSHGKVAIFGHLLSPYLVDSVTLQLERKSIVYTRSDMAPTEYYHPIGMAYVSGGVVHIRRISSIQELPPQIGDNFQLRRYEEVTTKRARPLKGKLVAVVEEDSVDNMALSFQLEKLEPVFSMRRRERDAFDKWRSC